MNNKNDKTFADLFSDTTSNSKKEDNKTSMTSFSDILKEKEIKEEEPLTFDSIFDKIPSTKTESTSLTETKEVIEPEEVIEEKTTENSEDYSFNSLFAEHEEKIKEELSFEHEPNLENPINEIDEITTLEENSIIEDNPFFEDNTNADLVPQNSAEEENQEINTNLFFEQEIEKNESSVNIENKADAIEINNTLDEPSKIEETNPFFTPRLDSTEERINDIDSKEIINNDLSDTTQNETKEVIEIDNVENEEKPVEIDSIFKETSKEDINPFLDNNTNVSLIATESILSTEPKKEVEESKKETSVSPFFEEEKKPSEEDNPFFQNKLNLVENQVPNTTTGTIDTSKTKHYNIKIVKKKDSPLKFIIGVLSYALFIWLLLIGIALLVYVADIKIRAAKGDYSSPTFNAYVVLTGSMLPDIKVYDVVVTKKVEPQKLKENDVITFASADSRFLGTIITHRIIKKNPPSGDEGYTFQTKGDNNNVADSALVPAKNIYGKVILKIPKLGYLQEFLASRGGWIIVILIPCLVVISYDIVKLIKGLKRRKYKNIKVQK